MPLLRLKETEISTTSSLSKNLIKDGPLFSGRKDEKH